MRNEYEHSRESSSEGKVTRHGSNKFAARSQNELIWILLEAKRGQRPHNRFLMPVAWEPASTLVITGTVFYSVPKLYGETSAWDLGTCEE